MHIGLIIFLSLWASVLSAQEPIKLQNFNKVSLASVYDGDTFKVYLACKYPNILQVHPRARARSGLPGNAWRHTGNKSRGQSCQSVHQAVFAGRQDIPAQLQPGQVFPPIM